MFIFPPFSSIQRQSSCNPATYKGQTRAKFVGYTFRLLPFHLRAVYLSYSLSHLNCMLIHINKLPSFPFNPRRVLRFLSNSSCSSDSSNDTSYRVSTLITKPSWDQNNQLKSLVSHMTPQSACGVIGFHSANVELAVRFFKWVCKQSTYCYDLRSRIHLVNLMISYELFGIIDKAIIILIKEYCSLNENHALMLMDGLDDMRKNGYRLSYPCYSILLMCLAKLKMGLLAFLVYKRMVDDGFILGFVDHKTMINALCNCGFVPAAEMFFSRVLKLGFPLDAHIYTSLVLGNCRVGDLHSAFLVFDEMSQQGGDCSPNSVTYSILIHGLCESGRLEEACRLKEEMSANSAPPSIRTYTVLIKAVCDIGSTDKAFELLDEMVKSGCKPNVYTFTILIDKLCREGKIGEANGLFRKMLKDGLIPAIVTFNALINGYCKEGRVLLAFELLSIMEKKNCRPNIRTYNELIEGLCRVSKSYKAMALLKRVIDNGLWPDTVTYNILVDGFCREGELEMACSILHSMKKLGLEPDNFTYTTLIDRHCKDGRVEVANGFLGLMMKNGIPLDEVTYTALIDGYCKRGKIGNAVNVFGQMVEDKCLVTPHTFNSFLDVLGKESKMNENKAVFGRMLKYGLLPSVVTYTILMDGLFRAGECTRSLKIFENMKRSFCRPNVYTYTVVIKGLCYNNQIQEAETLLYNMPQLGVYPNDITYSLLVKAHVKSGKLDRAFEIVSTMIKNHCQPSDQIFLALLTGFINTGIVDAKYCSYNYIFLVMDISQALKLRDKIDECGGPTVNVYNFLITGLCKVGRTSEAEHLIQEMMRNALFPNKEVFSLLIGRFCKDQKYDYCVEWMRLVLEKGFVPSFESYCSVVLGLTNEGKVLEGQKVVSDLIRVAGIGDENVISSYIEILVKGDEPSKCLELLKLVEQMHHYERPVI